MKGESEMEELGKLIRDLFDDQKMEIADLKGECSALRLENRKIETERRSMMEILKNIATIIAPLVVKSTTGEWYMQSLWGKDFEKFIKLLGIELKEEEE